MNLCVFFIFLGIELPYSVDSFQSVSVLFATQESQVSVDAKNETREWAMQGMPNNQIAVCGFIFFGFLIF